MFMIVFRFFSLFFTPKSKSLPPLYAQSLFFKERTERFALIALYKRATVSESLPLLFTQKQRWAIRTGRSWQKSDESDSLFFTSESLFFSYAHKKQAICSKYRWAKCQPWTLWK